MRIALLFRDKLVLYIVILFAISYAYQFLLIYFYFKNRLESGYIILLSYFPIIVLIILKLIGAEIDESNMGLELGDVKYYPIAILFPLGITYVIAAVDKILGIYVSFEAIRLALNVPLGLDWRIYITLTIFSLVIITPLMNSIITIGEEIGFRGFILAETIGRFDDRIVTIIIGILWVLWKAPLILFIPLFYFSGFPGILIFAIFMIEFSTFLIWLRIKSGGIVAPALGYASLNAQIILGSMIIKESLIFGAPVSLLGIIVQSVMLTPILKNLRIEFRKFIEIKDIKKSLKEVFKTHHLTP